ncbi:MAG: leucine dehydrogenase, partial [Bdellovibrionales bacterium]|nr:leucine dehydrogenase [Bdellovibrionales bacterium]
ALRDVLNLSEGMTYKNSLAGLNIGGGKSVIVGDTREFEGDAREALLEVFGRAVDTFDGRYYTAEDIGTSVSDMEIILRSTRFVVGGDLSHGGAGDPSPHTARGVFDGIRACLERVFDSDSLEGRHVAVQGIGHVGFYLVERLAKAGARLTITDTKEERVQEICKQFGASAVGLNDIYDVSCDVFAPCAVGGIINEQTVPRLNCKIVAGAANNQLRTPEAGELLAKRGIIYAPDFAINAGGVIMVSKELKESGVSDDAKVEAALARIYRTVGDIIDQSKQTGELTGAVALRLAKERIEAQR